ncbi:hypothetical protein H5410_064301 [Solanum commersonii]|uniref:Glycosyltransferase n=1 Tax=Solanum commersonii TaxID=4109 RepID=A0A9J5VZY2_SOLCO|nr:hypothetical protein H5410_064301 [Solanum commersonii]
MENLKNDCHVLLVTFQVKPNLTFNRISKLPNIEGLSFTPFSDGYDGKFKGSLDEFESFYSSLVSHGSKFVAQIIESRVVEGRPFKRVIYTTFMAWNCSRDQVVDLRGLPRLSPEENPRVLVNTFDDLEFDALRALKNLTMMELENYMDWLDTMTKESVIYIAFGSYSEISSQLMEEIGQGLKNKGKSCVGAHEVEVLQHPSLGCFLTHCGWNSTLESLSSGMPIVACPLWTDQGCNAKLVQDVWKIGVRVNASEEGVVERDEFKRCIDIVMEDGEKREELKKNAKKWKDFAKEAMKENGSSNNCDSKDKIIELLGLPPLSPIDFPSFVFDDVEGNNWAAESIKRQIDILNSKENPKILVNTFDDLEFDALRILKNVTMIEIGPSIPSIFLDDNSFQADMIEISSRNYMNWLDIMTKGSVIYVAFGSYTEASSQLMEEIGQGLLKCERPFLWVTREGQIEEKLTCKDELEKQGKLVSWCSQVEVLKHPSVESIASGVPIVACPIWNDQLCNAKLVQDVWKNDVKVNTGDGGIVERDEFERCIEIVMGNGEEGGKLRKNAKKWSDLAKEAMKKNGSSAMNVKTYANEFLLAGSW